MNKIEIKDLYLVFGPEKQKAFRMLKERKSKNEILKATNCTVAVKNANLTIKEGEFFVIMGLSGSGKSTLLRCINRLIKPTKGQVLINGTDITAASDKELLEMRRREIAMVFQNFGLLPHRSVLSNIAFGLELQGVPKQEREKKAMKSMEIVGLKGYQNQMVGQLSGGMQQRVGLARALANDPEILLMDEAFSALDPLIRVQMQDEMLALQSKMKKTIVFITHDLSEAIKLGDRIAIMRDGEVVQVGTSEEILTEPANDYVARFVENVDRSKIITAGSIMITRPAVARLRKEGPEVLIRKMKERDITVLPVIDENDKLIGEITLELAPEETRNIINDAIIQTKNNTGLILTFAFIYGGRDEIVTAAKKLCQECLNGNISVDDIDEDYFEKYLMTTDLPPVDLMIRTSGEYRLSNFLPWQLAYSEFIFTDVFWPDFDEEELHRCIAIYQGRERRFGGVLK